MRRALGFRPMGNAPGGCAHSPRRPLLNSGLLKPDLVHSPLLSGQGHTTSLKLGRAQPITQNSTRTSAYRARARIPPNGDAPGGLCALTAHPSQPMGRTSPRRRNAPRAGCNPGRSCARAGAPTLSCTRAGRPSYARGRFRHAPCPLLSRFRSGPRAERPWARQGHWHSCCAAGQAG